MKDVKEINEIPDLEKYLDKSFKFSFYEKGDNTVSYKRSYAGYDVCIEIITDESLFLAKQTLYEILDFDNIGFFQWSVYFTDSELLESYCYRPFIPDEEKDFYN